jgi:DNA mismatch endonuclease (patch repair protein)
MADFLTQKQRSERMALIKGKNNKSTELQLIQIFRKQKITGWRRNKQLIGKPDFVFPKHHVAIFVDGCFWHCCPKCYIRPRTNQVFWDKKRERNKKHDRKVTRELKRLGWKVLRLWEHELKNEAKVSHKVRTALSSI